MFNRVVMTVALTALVGCGDTTGPETDVIRLAGMVRDATTQAPIDGAQVILQWSAGAFGNGTEWAETDAQGGYSLQRDFGGARFSCDGFGITVQAAGYQSGFVQHGQIRCVSSVQTFDFALVPEN